MSEQFPNGITNGANWYSVSGGMQDWNYLNTNCFEITIEMGCFKYPNGNMLEAFWNENKYSLLSFIDQVRLLLSGSYVRACMRVLPCKQMRLSISYLCSFQREET